MSWLQPSRWTRTERLCWRERLPAVLCERLKYVILSLEKPAFTQFLITQKPSPGRLFFISNLKLDGFDALSWLIVQNEIHQAGSVKGLWERKEFSKKGNDLFTIFFWERNDSHLGSRMDWWRWPLYKNWNERFQKWMDINEDDDEGDASLQLLPVRLHPTWMK